MIIYNGNYNRNDFYKLNFIFIESNYFLDKKYNKKIKEYDALIDKPELSEKCKYYSGRNTLDQLFNNKMVLVDANIKRYRI